MEPVDRSLPHRALQFLLGLVVGSLLALGCGLTGALLPLVALLVGLGGALLGDRLWYRLGAAIRALSGI